MKGRLIISVNGKKFDLTPKKLTQQDYDNKVIEAYKDFEL